MTESKKYTEVDLTPAPPPPTDAQLEYAQLHADDDDYDGLDPHASVVHQLDTRTVSGSDQVHAEVVDGVSRAVDAAYMQGHEPSVGGILTRFRTSLRAPIRDILPGPDSDGTLSTDVITAAIELAVSSYEIETRVRPGRKRRGKEVRDVKSVRIEPRLLETLTVLGLDLQNVANGMAALVDRYHSGDQDATEAIELLGGLFAASMRSKPLFERLSPASIAKWRAERQAAIVARRRGQASAKALVDKKRAPRYKRLKGPPE